jgi:hypothetical protein
MITLMIHNITCVISLNQTISIPFTPLTTVFMGKKGRNICFSELVFSYTVHKIDL